jgi:hypothetical protein
MSNNNAENVSTGKPKSGGAIFVAPLGTALPTDATTALNAAFANTGYCSEDGLSNEVTTDTSSIKAWGGDEVDSSQTSHVENFKLSMIETNVVVLSQVYGSANVTVGANQEITVKHNALQRVAQSFVFEILLKGNRIKRIVVPNAKITSIDAVSYTDGDPIKYGVTLAAFPDANGDKAIEYIEDLTTTSNG